MSPDVWLGRPRGWCCLLAAPRRAGGRHAFSVRVRRLPGDAVLRIGWTAGSNGSPFNGWSYYTSPACFGGRSWKAHQELESLPTSRRRSWEPYGVCFHEGDLLTASVNQGVMSFARNGTSLGMAFRVPEVAEYRPLVALKRAAEVQLLPSSDVDVADLFTTPEQIRNMAWEARLCKRSNTLIMFQVFFLSLVRPHSEGGLDWDGLKREYDQRLGFPSPAMSSALMEHFAKIHRVVSLSGCEAWPLCFQMCGLKDTTPIAIDRMLFAAYQRATELGYKMPGRHDHA